MKLDKPDKTVTTYKQVISGGHSGGREVFASATISADSHGSMSISTEYVLGKTEKEGGLTAKEIRRYSEFLSGIADHLEET